MSFYQEHILPHIIHLACGTKPVRQQREKMVPLAQGRVLEVGMGSGLNLAYYDPAKVEFVWGLEPSPGMRKKAQKNLAASAIDVEWLDLPGEEIPLQDNSVDTVLLTFTLCTIPDWLTALRQMRRVLKRDGKLVFCEHGLAPDTSIQKWQERLNPYWMKFAGGCHLNRPIPDYLEQGGFNIQTIDSAYLEGMPKFGAFNYWGIAR